MTGSLGTLRAQVQLDVRQAVAAYAALRAQNARTVYALRGTGDSFVAAGKTMAVAGAGMVYGFSRVVMAAADFERKMDFFGAVSDTNSAQMQKLSDYTLKLAEDTIYSADEIADGIIELGKAGVNAEKIMRGIGDAMANLGAAGDIPLAESGQIITSTVQQFDLSARSAVKVTDLLAGAANASIADITDIGVSLKYVGGVANAAGLTFEDTATAISLLAKAGIRGSTAGTSLRQMIVSLGGATGPAREVLAELGILTEDGGNKFFTAEGQAKSLSQVFQILNDHTADLTQKQRLMALRTIFNNRALSAASILTREGAKGFRDMNKEMSKVTAADVAAQRLDNLSGDVEILQGNIQTLLIKSGAPFQETIRGWVQGLTNLIQAYSELDPTVQKLILQTIAISGVVLTAMGVISMIIGTIFRFVAANKKMWAGIKFLVSIFRSFAGALVRAGVLLVGWLMPAFAALAAALGITVGALLAIVAAVVAVVVGLVVLYKKWEPFRSLVNDTAAALWAGMKAIGAFFKALVTDPGKAWDMLKAGMSQLGKWIAQLGGWIWEGLKAGLDYIGQFVGQAIDWFVSLPGKILSALGGFVSKVLSLMTFSNLGYILGYALGTVVRLFLNMGTRAASLVLSMVNKIIAFFSRLPGKIGYFLGYLVGRAVAALIRLHARMSSLAARAVAAVIKFFAKLPGRVVSFITRMVTRGISLGQQFAQELPGLAARTATGIITGLKNLPGRTAAFFIRMAARARGAMVKMWTNAVSMGKSIFTGFINGIQGLPGAVGGILSQCISAIKGAITSAFNAVRDFAAGMWKGFKEGLGINSPSLIEKQMYQITKVTDDETKKMRNNVLRIQGVSKKIASTKFGADGKQPSPSAAEYRRLASMQRANQNRARTLAASSGNRRARSLASRNRGKNRMQGKVGLHIDNWKTGQGYMYGLAQDAVDDGEAMYETFDRMG